MVARYIVSAHAMNNGGPTALIIDRGDWTADMDFVGHKKVGGVKNCLHKRGFVCWAWFTAEHC